MSALYFGPVRDLPSWYWVGRDIAECLAGRTAVRYFHTVEDIADGAVVFWIKAPPPPAQLALARRRQLHIIYLPVDHYGSAAQIAADGEFIGFCRVVALHAPSLAPAFAGSAVELVDHYNKYGVQARTARGNGRQLWIGGLQYLPYVYRYLAAAGLLGRLRIDILTDLRSASGMAAGERLSRELALPLTLREMLASTGLNIMEWSELRQRRLLASCAGAFDVKHPSHFRQRHKPPTKMQKYVCSGIPCAVNRDSHLHRALGFAVCDPSEMERWHSAAYLRTVREAGRELAVRLTREAVAARYLQLAAPFHH